MFIPNRGRPKVIPGGPQILQFQQGGRIVPSMQDTFLGGGNTKPPAPRTQPPTRPATTPTPAPTPAPAPGRVNYFAGTRDNRFGDAQKANNSAVSGLGQQGRAPAPAPAPAPSIGPETKAAFEDFAKTANKLNSGTTTPSATASTATSAPRRGGGSRGAGKPASGTLTEKQMNELRAYEQGKEDYIAQRRADMPKPPKWYNNWITTTEGGKIYGDKGVLDPTYTPEGAAARREAAGPNARTGAEARAASAERQLGGFGIFLNPKRLQDIQAYDSRMAAWERGGKQGPPPQKPAFYDEHYARLQRQGPIDTPVPANMAKEFVETRKPEAMPRMDPNVVAAQEADRLHQVIQQQLGHLQQLGEGKGPNGEDLNVSSYERAPMTYRDPKTGAVIASEPGKKKGKGARFVQGLQNFFDMMGEGKGVVGSIFGAATDPLYDERKKAERQLKAMSDQYGAQFGHRKGERELRLLDEEIAAGPANRELRQIQIQNQALANLMKRGVIDPTNAVQRKAMINAGLDPSQFGNKIIYTAEQREFGGVMFERDPETGTWAPKGVVDPSKNAVAIQVVGPNGVTETYFMPSEKAGKAQMDLQLAGYNNARLDARQARAIAARRELAILNRDARADAAALREAGITQRQRDALAAKDRERQARAEELRKLLEEE